jgi:hypothetical protein
MLGIGKKLGDTMNGLALIAAPSLSKYHSRAREASVEGLIYSIAGIGNWRTHGWHSWSREEGHSPPIEGNRVHVFPQLTQSF